MPVQDFPAPIDDPRGLGLDKAFEQYAGTIEKFCLVFYYRWKKEGNRFRLPEEFLEDFKGEAYCKFPAAYHGFRGDSRFSTYLYRIIQNIFIDMVRKARLQSGVPVTTGLSREDLVRLRDLGVNTDRIHDTLKKAGIDGHGGRASMLVGTDDGDAIENLPEARPADPQAGGVDPLLLGAIEVIMKKYQGDKVRQGAPGGRDAINMILDEGIREMESPLKSLISRMYFIDDCNQAAIERQIDKKQSTISEHLAYARRHLLEFMKRRYPETTDLIHKINELSMAKPGKKGGNDHER